ncbi:MAG TPA: hypothetical protein VJX30_03010 [Terriglobales bacterium]|jgi:hypothetical protein|nr:hypothetical protein [Terriglobales bacterium]
MALTLEFPSITSNLKAGYGPYGTADPYGTTIQTPFPNGAYNPLGALYFTNAPANGGNLAISSATPPGGYAAGTWLKYVLLKGSQSVTMVAGPAPVVYVDDSFTTVSPHFADAYVGSNAVYTAGWLLPNTGSVAGVGVGSAVSGTILYNGGAGSYVWIAVQGFVPQAYCNTGSGAAAQGNFLYQTGDYEVTGIADGTAQPHRGCGYVWSTATSTSYFDVIATLPLF